MMVCLTHTAKRMVFLTDPDLKEAYHTFLKEYQDLGHMIPFAAFDGSFSPAKHYFLPHHGVWKLSSSITKLRTVFNGSLKVKSGNSLNDLPHAGPTLLPHLSDIISNWRWYRFVFTADVAKMYRQILIHPDDHKFQAILWRFCQLELIVIWLLVTLTYGLICSTYFALRCFKELAREQAFLFPLRAEILDQETYMDDVTYGGHTIHEANRKRCEINELLASAGFPLRKYISNCSKILEGVPEADLATGSKSLSDPSMSTSVLGVCWNPTLDHFEFKVQMLGPPPKLTKHVVLLRIAKIFNPMGWLSPIIITAKILMQSLWLCKLGWDDLVSSENRISWEK